jgi:hypothetical protein
MPEDTATLAPPADAGLPTGRPGSGPGGQSARSGDELITAAARGESLSEEDAGDLLDYFLANGDLPGDDEPVPVEFEIGMGRAVRKQVWQFRRIGWDEWVDAEGRGKDEKTGSFDGYVAASYVVARALVAPALGPGVLRLQKADPKSAPQDAAELLRRMFKKQSGTLLSLSIDVRRISRLGQDQKSSRILDEETAAAEA